MGGDYYDFFKLGRGRLGLALGDIAGKGIAAALLMANLQANLRSQIATASDHLQRFLQSVNQLFHGNTTDSAYATLFFAEYDDERRRLRYANCGHPAGLLLHRDGSVDRLEATGTVLGLFAQWDYSLGECQLFPGDILALYTDGVTESFDGRGGEYGGWLQRSGGIASCRPRLCSLPSLRMCSGSAGMSSTMTSLCLRER